MELAHLALSQLSVSAANMRARKKLPDVTDLIPSVRARGVLTPLLVRPGSAVDQFEVVAGRRRYHAVLAIAEDGDETPLLPCAIIAEGDDAAALEASIIENYARSDPDEVTQWVSFTRLIREGRSVAQVTATFGKEEPQVKRILALGNLLPRIRDLYAKGDIDAHSIRHLTMASRAKQTEWLALYRDPEAHAPTGQQLKNWLLGGQSIPATAALFDLAHYPDPIITDLFGGDQWFSNADSFWTLQREAIAKLRQTYLDAGWADVVVMEPGQYFQRWEHEKVGKKAGGKVYIAITRQGGVEAHEGWLTTREARKQERGAQSLQVHSVRRPELSSTLHAYIDLHRHAMVQVCLVQRPSVALRLLLAHAVAGSWLWNVKADPLRAPTSEIAESHEHCAARAEFGKLRTMARSLLGLDPAGEAITGDRGADIATLFRHLMKLTDEEVLPILAVIMAETLAVGSDVVEAVGVELAIDPLAYWQADEAFLGLLRQREVLGTLIGEVAGEAVASSNTHEKVKTLRDILSDCLAGTNGRPKSEAWAPRWLHFPATSYFAREDDEAETGDEEAMSDTGDVASCANGDMDADEERDFNPDPEFDEMAHVA